MSARSTRCIALALVTCAARTALAAPPEGPRPTGGTPSSTAANPAPEGAPHLTKTASVEVSGYLDDAATEVASPSMHFEIQNGLAGWGVGASLMVDVVTSASADVVATASPKWTDVRTAPSLDAHFKVGDTTLSFGGGASIESDFVAADASAGVAVDLASRTITPSFSYAFGYNLGGRRGTPYEIYQRVMHAHTLQAGVALVLDKATLLVPTFTASLEFGDSAKPYRWLPTFAPGTELAPGESVAEVNAERLDFEVEERLPQERQRYALSALLAHRFTKTTLRLDERLYADSWSMFASTTDFMLPIDVGDVVRLWPHARVNIQSGVAFWQIGYSAKVTAAGVAVTGLRTGDRELGPLLGLSLGGGIKLAASDAISVGLAADAVYTRFFDALYLTHRWAGFGAVTFDAEF